MAITRGTTPSIKYKFNVVNVPDIAVAYMTITQQAMRIEYDLTQAVVDAEDNSLTWSLTQEDTLQILAQSFGVNIQCRYRLADGTAGASRIMNVPSSAILKDGVI